MALPQSAIFSPTAARLAASTAKDWNTIDSWLHRHFQHSGRPIPKFERNPETLKALLALSSLNESADEERDLLCAVEKDALLAIREDEKFRKQQAGAAAAETNYTSSRSGENSDAGAAVTLKDPSEAPVDPSVIATGILETLSASLPKEGQTALSALASLSLSLDPPPPDPSPEVLAARLMALQSEIHLLEQQSLRLSTLSSYLSAETDRTTALLKVLRHTSSSDIPCDHGERESVLEEDNPYMPPPYLAKQNLETQRLAKKLSDTLPSTLVTGPSSFSFPSTEDSILSSPKYPTIPQLKDLEDSYKSLLSQKRALESQVGLFEGLPTDVDAAKQELDHRRRELAKITVKRDIVFESLVERESPMKRRQ